MPRLSDTDLTHIKAIPLADLLAREGLVLKPQGKDLVGCCVFHTESTASMVISPAKNLYHCFGCGAAGTPIDWVMARRGISFRAACDALQVEFGLVAESVAEVLPLDANAPQAALNTVIDYYHQTLKNNAEGLAYLTKRGLLSGVRGGVGEGQLVDRFKLGVANRTLTYRLPDKSRVAGATIRQMLQDVGILRASGHEHLNGSLVVPVISASGDVLDVYGRKLRDDLREGTAYHLYLKGEHRGVWNAQGLTAAVLAGQTQLILCESLIDAMSYWVHGFDNVTASYGVRGFTPAHVELFTQLKAQGLQRVLIAYDADKAGEDAANALVPQLLELGLSASRIDYPTGFDANQVAQLSDAAEQFKTLVLGARWLSGSEKSTSAPILINQIASAPITPIKTIEVNALQGNPAEYTYSLDGRRYRIRGLDQNFGKAGDDVLKVQLAVYVDDLLHLDKLDMSEDQRGTASPERKTTQCVAEGVGLMHLDKLDLYSYKQRQAFVHQAVMEIGLPVEVLKKDVGQLLLLLETARHEQQLCILQNDAASLSLTAEESQAAMALLSSPDLAQRIVADFKLSGLVGEDANMLVGYLACVSRKLDRPLAILIQSSSAAGKSSLMEAILSFMPEGERVQYSAMTSQSLYYMGENDLKHKILAISEEEGAHQASYALKLLQSEGRVKIASAGKDEATGKLTTQSYEVEGPVMLMMTTTAIDIDEELLNRCLVLSVNEGRAQTQAIHEAQRYKRTLDGLQAKVHTEAIRQTHQHAQHLLERLAVINPYAQQLTFTHTKTRSRRDHEKYLTLIDAIALLHQHQRTIHSLDIAGKSIRYVEVSLADIELANRLATEVLGRTLDELPPQSRKLLSLIYQTVGDQVGQKNLKQTDYLFSRKDIRGWCGWSDTQLKVHLDRLCEMEYVLAHKGSKGKSYVYELLYQGEGEQDCSFVMGLLNVDQLKSTQNKASTTTTSRALKDTSRVSLPQFAGVKRVENGGVTGEHNTPKASINKASSHNLTA